MIFIKEPKDQAYRELIDVASSFCTKFLLVKRIHSSLEINSNCERVLKELDDYLIEARDQSHWPGTMLLNETAIVYYYRLNYESRELLKKYAQRLYSWIHPNLPEDLCFLKNEETPWLISIAHEREAWIENEIEEEIQMLTLINGIELSKEK